MLSIADIVDMCDTYGILKVRKGGSLYLAIVPFIETGMLVLIEELKNYNVYKLNTNYKQPTFKR